MPKPESRRGSASRKSRKPGSKKQFTARKKPTVKKKTGAKKTAPKKSGGKKTAGKKKSPAASKKVTKKPAGKSSRTKKPTSKTAAGSKGSKKVRPASAKKPSASPKRGGSKLKKPARKVVGGAARPAAAKTGRKPKKTTAGKKPAASAAVTLRGKAPRPKAGRSASGAVTLAKRGGKRGAASGAVTMGRKAPKPKAGKAASGTVTLKRPPVPPGAKKSASAAVTFARPKPGGKKGAASGAVTMKSSPPGSGTKPAASGTITRSEPDPVSHRKAPRSSDRGAAVQAVSEPVSEHREWLTKPMPETYGENKIVCMVKDPYWLFVYWDVQENRVEEAERTSRTAGKNPKLTLRVNRLGEGDPAHPAPSHQDIEIVGFTKSWYIDVGVPDQSFTVEIGVKDDSEKFISIARSNAVKTPGARISGVESAEWRSIPEAMEMGGEFIPGVSVFGSESVHQERYKKFGPASDSAQLERYKK